MMRRLVLLSLFVLASCDSPRQQRNRNLYTPPDLSENANNSTYDADNQEVDPGVQTSECRGLIRSGYTQLWGYIDVCFDSATSSRVRVKVEKSSSNIALCAVPGNTDNTGETAVLTSQTSLLSPTTQNTYCARPESGRWHDMRMVKDRPPYGTFNFDTSPINSALFLGQDQLGSLSNCVYAQENWFKSGLCVWSTWDPQFTDCVSAAQGQQLIVCDNFKAGVDYSKIIFDSTGPPPT